METMEALAIGIISGLYSSVIISVIFYILSEYQKELLEAKNMIYPAYGILVADIIEDKRFKTKCDEMAIANFNDITNNFSKFEPWRFKYELKVIMCNINEIVTNGKYYDNEVNLNINMLHDFTSRLQKYIDEVEDNEKKFYKYFLLRIIKNRIIQILCLFFIVIILLAIFFN